MKQLILLLALAGLISHSQAQGKRSCANNGEYCLVHTDCCSGSCLSFSYKCVPTPPSAQVGTTFVPVTVDTANRFGNDGGASITQKTCARNGEYCLTHQECCSGACLSFSYKCVPLQPAPPGSDTAQSTPAMPSPSQPGNAGTTVDLGNRVGESQEPSAVTPSLTTTAASTTPKTCAAIGEYCLLSTECCSGACLSFSYKCVTNPKVDVVGQTQVSQPAPQAGATNTAGLANRFEGSSGTSTTAEKKCASVGEYCLTAADCCSKSCLSFSYKCVNNYDLGTQQLTSSGIPVRIPPSTGSGTNAIDNRFGGANGQCKANGYRCYNHGECCSGTCYKLYCAAQIQLGIPESELTRPSVANGPYVQVNSLDDLINRFSGGGSPLVGDSSASGSSHRATNAVVGVRSGAARQCLIVGDSCGRHEECCSLKCLTYIRKCVT